MTARNTVGFLHPNGITILQTTDGSYVLAQQLDNQPLALKQLLEGAFEEVGFATATDPKTRTTYEFFVEAYGLSKEAAFEGQFDR